jgi:hypothetical protein
MGSLNVNETNRVTLAQSRARPQDFLAGDSSQHVMSNFAGDFDI